jgi:hypothetical protein
MCVMKLGASIDLLAVAPAALLNLNRAIRTY